MEAKAHPQFAEEEDHLKKPFGGLKRKKLSFRIMRIF